MSAGDELIVGQEVVCDGFGDPAQGTVRTLDAYGRVVTLHTT